MKSVAAWSAATEEDEIKNSNCKKKKETMRGERLKRKQEEGFEWVFFFISHETSDALNATFFSFFFPLGLNALPYSSDIPRWVSSRNVALPRLRSEERNLQKRNAEK